MELLKIKVLLCVFINNFIKKKSLSFNACQVNEFVLNNSPTPIIFFRMPYICYFVMLTKHC